MSDQAFNDINDLVSMPMLDLESIQLELDELDIKFPNSLRGSYISNPYEERKLDLSKIENRPSISTERVQISDDDSVMETPNQEPDIFQQLTHIINSSILESNLQKINYFSKKDMVQQIKAFLVQLEQISQSVELIIKNEFSAGTFKDGYDLNELSEFSQMYLVQKIRKNSSHEFISIIDAVFVCEMDYFDDLSTTKQSVKMSIQQESQSMEAFKQIVTNDLMETFENNIRVNHEIFHDCVPKCLIKEIMQIKIQPRIDEIFGQIQYELTFEEIQYKNFEYATPQGPEKSSYLGTFLSKIRRKESKEEQVQIDYKSLVNKFNQKIQEVAHSEIDMPKQLLNSILQIMVLSCEKQRIYVEKICTQIFKIPQEQIDVWKNSSEEYLPAEIHLLKQSLEDKFSPDFDTEQKLMMITKHVYSKIQNIDSPPDFIYNKALNRSIIQRVLSCLFKNRIKEAMILQNLETFLFLFYDIQSLGNLRTIYQSQRADLKCKLEEIDPFYSVEISKSYGNSGFCNFMTPGINQEQTEAKYQKICQKAIQIVNQVKGKNGGCLPKLILDQISGKPSSEANHVTISVSGYLSEDVDKRSHWQGLCKHFQYGQPEIFDPAIFSVTWESKTQKDLNKAIIKSVGAAAVQGVISYASGPMSKLGMAMMAAGSANELQHIKDLFQQAKKQAKHAGQLLACSLVLRDPFRTQTVSLVGFSLGTQVIKSCLKTLNDIYADSGLYCDIIQNVTLMGGATHFSKNISKYEQILRTVVNGEFKNVYSKNDNILYLYSLSEMVMNSAGRNQIKIDGVQNFDISSNVISKRLKNFGHTDYMDETVLMELFLNINLS